MNSAIAIRNERDANPGTITEVTVATFKIMLDRTAPKFLEFECLAFMVGCFTRALIKTAQCNDVVGWE